MTHIFHARTTAELHADASAALNNLCDWFLAKKYPLTEVKRPICYMTTKEDIFRLN